MVVSEVAGVKLAVLPPDVEELPVELVPVLGAGMPAGHARPHMASVEMSVDGPTLGTPSQAANANADKTKADTDPIRMIFPTTQIIHR